MHSVSSGHGPHWVVVFGVVSRAFLFSWFILAFLDIVFGLIRRLDCFGVMGREHCFFLGFIFISKAFGCFNG